MLSYGQRNNNNNNNNNNDQNNGNWRFLLVFKGVVKHFLRMGPLL